MKRIKLMLDLICTFVCIQSTFPLKLFYANQKDVRMFWTDGKSYKSEKVLVSSEDAVAVDFLYKNNSMFWSDVSEQKIYTCSVKTLCKPNVIVSANIGRPEGLAVDWLTGNLYWTDCDFKLISVLNIDGKHRKALIWNNLDNPRAIAVDPSAGFMFWSDWGESPRVSRAGLDGSNQTNIVQTFITWPNGLTLDYPNKKVYWLDARHHYIASVDYNGNNKRMMYTQAVNHPYSLTMVNEHLFWTDWDTSSIRTCRVSSRNVNCTVSVIKTGIFSPMDVKVYDDKRQSNVVLSPCMKDNGGCSHLCLLAPTGRRYSCACPSGIALMSNMRTCEDGPQKFLLLAQQTEIRILSLSTDEHADLALPISNIGHVVAVDFDPLEELVCWIDSQHHEIKCARLNGSDGRTIVKNNETSAEGLAIDWVNRAVYWSDTGSDRIEMSYLNGSSQRVVVSGELDEPRAVGVDPKERFLYWSDWGAVPKLERAKLDGSQREIIINTSIAWPNSLVIDYKQRKLFWADAKLDKIESCDMTGANRAILTRVGVPHIVGLTLIGQYLYWIDLQTRILGRIDQNNVENREVIADSVENVMAVKGVDLKIKHRL